MRWIVGDVQGCAVELEQLLETIRFDPSRDQLWCAGDLVNRGPDSLAALRLWRDVGGAGVVGNHEIDALLAFSGTHPRPLPRLQQLFDAEDAGALMDALRVLPGLVFLPSEGDGPDAWLVHAGVHPAWSDLEREARRINAGPHDDTWCQSEDVRYITNVRCCTPDGVLIRHTGPPESCPHSSRPWDTFYRGATLIVHGHWAARGHYRGPGTLGLDSGCVYGGLLTAWCQEEDRIVQIPSTRG